jgi:hypothetical protein
LKESFKQLYWREAVWYVAYAKVFQGNLWGKSSLGERRPRRELKQKLRATG